MLVAGATVTKDLARDYVAQDLTYPQTPPVGGKHWPPQAARRVFGWQASAVYPEPVVDEFAVHSLEHGAVWRTYRPGTSAANIAPSRHRAIAKVAGLAGIRPAYVLVSPNAGQTATIVATAWGVQLPLECLDDERLVWSPSSAPTPGEGRA